MGGRRQRWVSKKMLALVTTFALAAGVVSLASPWSGASGNDGGAISFTVTPDPLVDVMVATSSAGFDSQKFGTDLKSALAGRGVNTDKVEVTTTSAVASSTDQASAADITSSWASMIANPGLVADSGGGGWNTTQTSVVSDNTYNQARAFLNTSASKTQNADFNFNWGIDPVNYGSFAHGEVGFIFGAKDANNYYAYLMDNHSGCGFIRIDGGEAIVKVTNGSLSIVSQATGFPMYYPGQKETISINITGNKIAVARVNQQGKGNRTLTYTDPSTQQIEGSYGFYVYRQYGAYFDSISATTQVRRDFNDILQEPKWRDKSQRFMVNVQSDAVKGLDTPNGAAEASTRLITEDVSYIGIGTESNKAQADSLIAQINGNGMFTSASTYQQQVSETADYIAAKIQAQNGGPGDQYVIAGGSYSVNVSPESMATGTQTADFPQGRWRVDHDQEFFENDYGQYSESGQYRPDFQLPLDKPGKYEVFFGNGHPNPQFIYVHRLPIAQFKAELNKTGGVNTLTMVDVSYDPDRESDDDHGLAEKEWKWKEAADAGWTEGQPPATLPNEGTYTIQLRVKDKQGAWSEPTSKYVSTVAGLVTEPVADFTLPVTATKYDTVSIDDLSYDPSGSTITGSEWKVYKAGALVYKGAAPLTNFSGTKYGVGEYKVTLQATNAGGKTSKEFSRFITITEDETPPEATVDPVRSDASFENVTVTAEFTDLGGSGFDSQRVAITSAADAPASDDPAWSTWNSSTTRIVTLDHNGTFYVHFEAKDGAGNLLQKTTGTYSLDKRGRVSVEKTDGRTGLPVAGASFEARKSDGTVVAAGVTDENGEWLSDYLTGDVFVGDEVTLYETQAPVGYIHSEPRTVTVTRDGDADPAGPIVDARQANNVSMSVTDSITGNPVAGVTFSGSANPIGESGQFNESASPFAVDGVSEFTTGEDGTFTIDGGKSDPKLVYGDLIELRQISQPEGYTSTRVTTPSTGSVLPDGELSLSTTVSPKRSVSLDVRDASTGEAVPQSDFAVCYAPSGPPMKGESPEIGPCPVVTTQITVQEPQLDDAGQIIFDDNGIPVTVDKVVSNDAQFLLAGRGATNANGRLTVGPMDFVAAGDSIIVVKDGADDGYEKPADTPVIRVADGENTDSCQVGEYLGFETAPSLSSDADRSTIDCVVYQYKIPTAEVSLSNPDGGSVEGAIYRITAASGGSWTATTDSSGHASVTMPGVKPGENTTAVQLSPPSGAAADGRAIHATVGVLGAGLAAQFNISVDSLDITTEAKVDGGKLVYEGGGTVVDTVGYSGLIPGMEYTIEGSLNYVTATGYQPTGLTKKVTFTAPGELPKEPDSGTVMTFEPVSGSANVTFDVPNSMRGNALVVFEKLHAGSDTTGPTIAYHTDHRDSAQTVYFPVIRSSVANLDQAMGNSARLNDTIVDTISVCAIQPGAEFELRATLTTSTGRTLPALPNDSAPVSSDTVGCTDIALNLDLAGRANPGETITVSNALYAKGASTAVATSGTESNPMTVYIPKISTLLADATTGLHTVTAGGSVSDTISYENLRPNASFKVVGELKVIGDDGTMSSSGITVTNTFNTSNLRSGTYVLNFGQMPASLTGKTVVAFEKIYFNSSDNPLAEHTDASDLSQTVWIPSVSATVGNVKPDLGATVNLNGVIKSDVTYSSVEPGGSYTARTTFFYMSEGNWKASGVALSKSFTASVSSGSLSMQVGTPDSAEIRALSGKRLFGLTEILSGETMVAVSDGRTDSTQELDVPGIFTTTSNGDSGKNALAGDTVIDLVHYSNLNPGVEYTVTPEIRLLGSNSSSTLLSAPPAVAFTPTAASGTVEIPLVLPASTSNLIGSTLVVHETISRGADLIISHKDDADSAQYIYLPGVSTQISNQNSALGKLLIAGTKVTDRVFYQGLQTGVEYTASGVLVTVNEDGTTTATLLRSQVQFTPTKNSGSVDVVFNIPNDFRATGGKLVAFETIKLGDHEVVSHKDATDANQTVFSPIISTTASNSDPRLGNTVTRGGAVTDTVSFFGVQPGLTYQVAGKLMTASGLATGITATGSFTPATTDGVTAVSFTVPSSIPADLAGTTWVAVETLTTSGVLIAEHNDLADANQTVYVPSVTGVAGNAQTELGRTVIDGGSVTENITYAGLKPNTDYTANVTFATTDGVDTGVAAAKTFTTDVSGAGQLALDIATSSMASAARGKVWQSTETITEGGNVVLVNVNGDNKLYWPNVTTEAKNKDIGLGKIARPGDTIVDTITYTGFEPGVEYVVDGELMGKTSAGDATGTSVAAGHATFTTTKTSGAVQVEFVVPDSGTSEKGMQFVAFEKVTRSDIQVAAHADLSDARQTVVAPGTTTNAVNADPKLAKLATPGSEIVDSITYTQLQVGKRYVASGELFADIDGVMTPTSITAQTTFITRGPDGIVNVRFRIPRDLDAKFTGVKLVAYEDIILDGAVVDGHKDPSDTAQTVYVPNIEATPSNKDKNLGRNAIAGGTVVDTIDYAGLQPGLTYAINGALTTIAGAATGVAATIEFTPDTSAGSVDVEYVLPSDLKASLTGKLWKSVERVTLNGVLIASNKTAYTDAKTVFVPSLVTAASNAEKALSKVVLRDGGILDTVTYAGLQPGLDYLITGKLMADGGNGPVTETGISLQSTLTPKESSGTIDVLFDIPAEISTSLTGKSWVAFEELSINGSTVVAHADSADLKQTVYMPAITSRVFNTDANLGQLAARGGTITDEVHYSGLQPGISYVAQGSLEGIDENGTARALAITGSKKFTAKDETGVVSVTMTIPKDVYSGDLGMRWIASEKITLSDIVIAAHTDMMDSDQNLFAPSISGQAGNDNATYGKIVLPDSAARVDVSYKGFQPGATYKVIADLWKVTDTGTSPTGLSTETSFTASHSTGTEPVLVAVPKDLDPRLAGARWSAHIKVMVSDVLIAEIVDDVRTDLSVYVPSIATSATNANKKFRSVVVPGGKLVDTISFAGLEPGRSYQVQGVFAPVEGAAIASGRITATSEFTPRSQTGSTNVVFEVPADAVTKGGKWVASEVISVDGKVIAVHDDSKDLDQTVFAPEFTVAIGNSNEGLGKVLRAGDTVVETITYRGLEPGVEYSVSGRLVDGAGRARGLTAATTFTPGSHDGSVAVSYAVPKDYQASGLTLSSVETVSMNGVAIKATDSTPAGGREVFDPQLSSGLRNSDDSLSNVVVYGGKVTDTVTYAGLQPGLEYEAAVELFVDGNNGRPVSSGITKKATFVPSSTSGTVNVDLSVPLDIDPALVGRTWFASDSVTLAGKTLLANEYAKDAAHQMFAPVISGVDLGAGADSGRKVITAGEKITGKATFRGLQPGLTYAVSSILYSLDSDGAKVHTGVQAKATFTAAASDVAVALDYLTPENLDDAVVGRSWIADTKISLASIVIAKHLSTGDDVFLPQISMIARNFEDVFGDMVIGDGKIAGEMTFSGLQVDRLYTATATIYRPDADGSLVSTGLTGTTEFVPDATAGTVVVGVNTPGNEFERLRGQKLVLFATVSIDGKSIFDVDYIDGANNSVFVPSLKSGFKFSGGVLSADSAYQNLSADKKYALTSTLQMHGGTGESGDLTATDTFVAIGSDGGLGYSINVPANVLALAVGSITVTTDVAVDGASGTSVVSERHTVTANLVQQAAKGHMDKVTVEDMLKYLSGDFRFDTVQDSGGFPWWIVLIGLAALMLLGGGWLWARRRRRGGRPGQGEADQLMETVEL